MPAPNKTLRPRAPTATTSSCCCAAVLLLLGRRPTAVEGFVVFTRGGSFGIRDYASDAAALGWESSSSSSRGSSRTTQKASGCMFMGASRDDHTDRKDQWEGWDMEESGAAEENTLPDVQGRDWRLFRKNLISQYGEDNGKDPWSESCWAHDIGIVEPGSLLIATEEIEGGIFRQSVIIILSHHRDEGTLGLIINHPGPQRLHSLPAIQKDLAEVFGDSQVFDGGPMGLGTMTVLHDAEVEGCDAVLKGVYTGGFESLIEATRQGRVSKDHVRFVHGHAAWSPGQLQEELDSNQWFLAAAAPELMTGDCDEPLNPLWGKLLGLMGGTYQEVAKRNAP